jgi:deoxycytidylate deaminase
MTEDRIVRMLRNILTTEEDEADCDECFEHLDKFVELVQSGEDAGELLPRVEEHLAHCRCCHEEYDALLSLLRAGMASDDDA